MANPGCAVGLLLVSACCDRSEISEETTKIKKKKKKEHTATMVVSYFCIRSTVLKVLLALFMLCFLIFTSEAAPTYVYHVCANTTTYRPNSTYQVNLNSLLSTLSSNNTRNDMFYKATAGNSSSGRAYGLFMCRGDVMIDVCRDCVVNATSDILEMCPEKKKAYVWYDECFLRYDNERFFATMGIVEPVVFLYNMRNETWTDIDFQVQVLESAMSNLATQASSNQSANGGQLRGFATGETKISGFDTVYYLVQCIPDLSAYDCKQCLFQAIALLPRCCTGRPSARVLFPSCNIRYDRHQFFRDLDTAVTPLPPSLPPTIHPRPRPSPAAAPRPSTSPGGNGGMSALVITGIVVGMVVSVLLFILGFCFLRRRAKKYESTQEATDGNEILIPESLQYNLSTISTATNNFSAENKVGEGGFGDVYKGTLSNGQEIAVKRLSKNSGQGAREFKNEVVLVAKLQHRNLVRLVGFCLEQEEKLLIYEFVANKSLDYFLFDREKQKLLDWSTRYKIISGIAQGILYLHEHSRLKIIHRDLKASNVLLDEDMNPKISDFGMAKLVGVDQSQANTNRIMGTFGYMAPEYAMHGEFSVKSDVFSFGVLLLEIISGKKNNRFYQSEGSEDLLSHAWKHWKDSTPLELVDPTLKDSMIGDEVIRCIHIGLLCVQEDSEERPTMTSVLLMLNGYSFPLPLPHQPASLIRSREEAMLKQHELDSRAKQRSANEV